MNEADTPVAPWLVLLEELDRHFSATRSSRCLLWVDPAQADPFESNPIVEKSRVRVPIRHPRFDQRRAPYVVPLDLSRSADADVFRDSVELAWLSWSTEYLSAMQGQAICGWVNTAETPKEVVGHWGRNCHLHLGQGQTKLLRFQDPGVREWLWPNLSEAQQRAMLGPTDVVHAMGRGQQLIRHCRGDSARSQSSTSPAELNEFPALQLNQAQWDQVADYATVHAAWLSWRKSATNEAVVRQTSGWERPILHALTAATRFGLRDATDRELFALHTLQLGPGFYKHPRLEDIWRKTQAGDFYGRAIEELIGCSAQELGAFVQALPASHYESKHDNQQR